MFESELFGYEAGSFTGGIPDGQRGKFDLADGGTLFLDEISELNPALQAKLLRVIQEKEFYRVGGLKKIQTDVRLICATNRMSPNGCRRGFRADLYYRFNVAPMSFHPAGAARRHYAPGRNVSGRIRRSEPTPRTINPEAQGELLGYNWPGNVRELRNTMEWLAFSGEANEREVPLLNLGGRRRSDNHKSNFQGRLVLDGGLFELPADAFDLDGHMSRIILQALNMNNGNKTATAKYLGISRRVLEGRFNRIQERQD